MPTCSLSRSLRAAALSSALMGFTVWAPMASAAEVKVPGKCYTYWPAAGQQAIPVDISGLNQSQSVKVSLIVKKRVVSGIPSLIADTTGGVTSAIENWTSGLPSGPTRSTKAKVAINDLTTGDELAAASFKVANVAIRIESGKKKRSYKRTWEISGLASWGESAGGGKVYYAYYFDGDKQIGKQRIGKAQDACGYVKAKKVLIPFKRNGLFVMKVQASRTWKGDALPWISYSVGTTL